MTWLVGFTDAELDRRYCISGVLEGSAYTQITSSTIDPEEALPHKKRSDAHDLVEVLNAYRAGLGLDELWVVFCKPQDNRRHEAVLHYKGQVCRTR